MSFLRSSSGIALRLKFNLILIAIFLVSIFGAGVYYYDFLERGAFEDVRHDSDVLMETALACCSSV